MYTTSRPTTPFIPPRPGQSPATNVPVIPPAPANAGYPGPWGATPSPAAPVAPLPGAPWPPYATPYPGRGRSNSYHGMPPGGPPFDASAYFGYPAPYTTTTPAAPTRGLAVDPYWVEPAYLTPEYGRPTPVIPPRPSRSHSRSRSRGSNNGLPPDWVGPTRPGEPLAVPQPMPVPPEFAGHVPPGTPWYPPPAVPGTGFSNFQYPLPPVAGYPPRQGHYRQRSHSTHPTPWLGGGYLPPEPGPDEDPYDRAARPQHGSGMVDTRWFSGKDYGPVLDPLLAGVVKCTFKVNPLLAPAPDDPAKRPYLTWNMLFSSAFAHRSDERAQQSWMRGRDAPATFPRLSALRIISRSFPWFIDVKAHSRSKGVTCGDVIDTLSSFLTERTGEKEFRSLPPADQARVTHAYYHNRSMADDVPGGRLGEGMRRCDFLGEETMWGGLEVDQKYVAERMSITGRTKRDPNNVFVLNCEKRLPSTSEERRDQAARGRSTSRADE